MGTLVQAIWNSEIDLSARSIHLGIGHARKEFLEHDARFQPRQKNPDSRRRPPMTLPSEQNRTSL
jgi:hypothetical protein